MTSPYPDPKRDKSCWVAWYYEDFRAGTAEMSFGAKGLYVTMLNHQWSHGSIPNPERDPKAFCRALGCLPEDLEELWPEVSSRFVEDGSGRLVNGRAQRESEARGKKREQTIRAIRKRWDDTSVSTDEHTSVSTEQHTKPDTEPHTSPSPSPSLVLEVSNAPHSQGIKLKKSALTRMGVQGETAQDPPAKASGAAARPVRSAMASRATAEECEVYAVEQKCPRADGRAFFDSMLANGWRTKTGPVKDWRAAFRTRKSNGWLPSQKNGNGSTEDYPTIA